MQLHCHVPKEVVASSGSGKADRDWEILRVVRDGGLVRDLADGHDQLWGAGELSRVEESSGYPGRLSVDVLGESQ